MAIARGGITEVARGVHLINTYANMYLLADQRLVLVDTSSETEPRKFFDLMGLLKLNPADLSSIIVTHTHPDHVTGLAAVKRRAANAQVAAHEIEAPFVAKERIYDGPPGAASQRHTGVPVDVRLKDGQTFEGFQVVHTPGHTRGHISLYDKERRLLIAGDAINTDPESGPLDAKLGVGRMIDAYNVDPKEHVASIRKLAGLDFETLVVGHGSPVARGAAEAVRAYVRSLP